MTVETAGTLAPEFQCDLLSISPKTSSSDPLGRWRSRHRARRSDLAPLRLLLQRHPDYQLKFVVRDGSDMPEVEALVESASAERSRVLLMPEGRTAGEVAARSPEVAALCLRHGFRFSPRLHLALFGPGRGV